MSFIKEVLNNYFFFAVLSPWLLSTMRPSPSIPIIVVAPRIKAHNHECIKIARQPPKMAIIITALLRMVSKIRITRVFSGDDDIALLDNDNPPVLMHTTP